MRSRAAASILQEGGFDRVFSMQGGLNAWEGARASGAPESGSAFFSRAAKPEEMLALAWTLEEGSRTFYTALAGVGEAARTYTDLAAAEEGHKRALAALYAGMFGSQPGPEFSAAEPGGQPAEQRMEGGVAVSEALTWARGAEHHEVLEFCIALEANALDLYIKLSRRVSDPAARNVLLTLSGEERVHLDRMSELLIASAP